MNYGIFMLCCSSGILSFKSPAYRSVERGLNEQCRMPTLRVMPMPSDANIHGDVFGGWIMAQVDLAAAVPAVRRASGRVGTVAVNSFVFKQPVFVGDLLSFYAKIIKTGTTSITVNVEVYAERHRLESDVVKVTEATLTYVATDENRRPRSLPALT